MSKASRSKWTRRGVLGTLVGTAASVTAAPRFRSGPARAPDSAIRDQGMQVVITGSGSALIDPKRGGASQAVLVDGTILLFDCGRRAMDNLAAAGINPVDVDYVFFTHLHFDHIATYGYFVVSSWIAGRRGAFKVFGPPGTKAMSDGALYGMHQMDVEFVKKRVRDPVPMQAEPEPPVEVSHVSAGAVVETDKFKVTAALTPHLTSMGKESYAYRIDSSYGSVVISGDTGPADSVIELAKGADMLIHECTFAPDGMTVGGSFNSRKKPSTGHTAPSELGELAQEAGVKKVVATHVGPFTSGEAAIEMSRQYFGEPVGPEIWMELTHQIRANFDGPVILAEDGMVLDIG